MCKKKHNNFQGHLVPTKCVIIFSSAWFTIRRIQDNHQPRMESPNSVGFFRPAKREQVLDLERGRSQGKLDEDPWDDWYILPTFLALNVW